MKYNKPIEEMDTKTQQIYKDLCNGADKKATANKYNVTVAEVMTIAKRYNTGQKKQQVGKQVKPSKTKVKAAPVKKSEKKNVCGLSDEKMIEVLLDIESGMSNAAVSKKYGISTGSVYNIKKEYGLLSKYNESGKTNTDISVVNKIKTENPVDNFHKVYTKNDIIYAGLVSGRHDMPCTKFIFGSALQEDLMFDYEQQEKVCKDFIEANAEYEDGAWNKSLQVFVTGMTCCLASLIKVCSIMKINLSLMHYNNSTGRYRGQVIWKDFKCSGGVPEIFSNNWAAYHYVYTYKCSIEDISKSEIFYNVSEIPNNDKSILILCTNKDHMMEAYNYVIQDSFAKKRNGAIFANQCELISERGFKSVTEILRTNNNFTTD